MLANRMNVRRDQVFDLPAYMIEDELMLMAAEAAQNPDTSQPTQDLLAGER